MIYQGDDIGTLGGPDPDNRKMQKFAALTAEEAQSLAEELIALTLTMVAASVVLHGISVTPLMNLYARRERRR